MHLKMLRAWDSEDSGNKELFFLNRRLCTQVLTPVHFPARRDMFERQYIPITAHECLSIRLRNVGRLMFMGRLLLLLRMIPSLTRTYANHSVPKTR